MAYIKFKELTRYFSFWGEIDSKSLPNYVTDYISENEEILIAYKTTRDKAVFTNKRVIIFDCNILGGKTIYIIPYKSISTGAIQFQTNSAKILISLDSGYQIRWDFTKMEPDNKKNLRHVFNKMMDIVVNNKSN